MNSTTVKNAIYIYIVFAARKISVCGFVRIVVGQFCGPKQNEAKGEHEWSEFMVKLFFRRQLVVTSTFGDRFY